MDKSWGAIWSRAILALISSRSIEEAAKTVAISSAKTLFRWQKLPEFERAYREVRVAAFRQSTARLQQAAVRAVTTLLKVLVDPAAPLAVKARCAYYILDQTKRAIETEEIEARVAELERLASKNEND